MVKRSFQQLGHLTAFGIWLVLVGSTFAWLIVYGSTAGSISSTPERWPANSDICRATGKKQLLVFLHSECPCSRATLDNLKPLLTDDHIEITLVCLGTSPIDSSDSLGGCHQALRAWKDYANVTVIFDRDGHEAQRFGALTSGHCLLYDIDDTLSFNGGVTSSRGHYGANSGFGILQSILHESHSADSTYPVFGCPLREEHFDETGYTPIHQLLPTKSCEERLHA
ncbi:hypothetical protein [Blastopirellula marina]|uniref:hypothetical protein n=1 Tax=Blastopirellula marina TaxID=124 RepID=UPI001304971F|nr:hypothetical protein [Blastopirellula marina]